MTTEADSRRNADRIAHGHTMRRPTRNNRSIDRRIHPELDKPRINERHREVVQHRDQPCAADSKNSRHLDPDSPEAQEVHQILFQLEGLRNFKQYPGNSHRSRRTFANRRGRIDPTGRRNSSQVPEGAQSMTFNRTRRIRISTILGLGRRSHTHPEKTSPQAQPTSKIVVAQRKTGRNGRTEKEAPQRNSH